MPAGIAGATPGYATTVPLANGDAGVAQTIELMRALVLTGDPQTGAGSRVDPYIRSVAGQLVAPLDPRDQVSHAAAIFDWIRGNVRFVRDPNQEELVQNPRWTLQYGFGDCDDISTLIASLVESVGIPAGFVTVSLAGQEFDHVYVVASIGGQQIPMDIARMNPQFGVTSTNAFRTQVWPIDPDSDAAAISGGKHYSDRRSVSQLNGAIATLGDDGGSPDTYDPSTNTTFTTDSNGQTTSYTGLPESPTYVVNGTNTEIQNPYYNNPAAAAAAEAAFYGTNVTAAQVAAIPPGMSATQIAQLVNAGGNSAAAIIKAINTPTSPYYNPMSPYYGIGSLASQSSLFGISGLSTNMLLLLFGGLLLVSSRK